ncbi:hypothetical protein [Solihabitans fulvus]|uniref:hypothetical protein n=1 Tax=Solihabitans fulvus TaxID=1892852 RepID=UPI001CB7608A|nr:hypothetical protein [Solihabitans fulvus]
MQVHEQLSVGKPRRQGVGRVHGQRGLAYAGHSVDHRDRHRGGRSRRQPRELGKLLLAADEIRQILRQ